MSSHTCFNQLDYKKQSSDEDYYRFMKIDFDPATQTDQATYNAAKKYIKLNDYIEN